MIINEPSFHTIPSTFKIEYDALLTGLGVILLVSKEEGSWLTWKVTSIDLPFILNSSRYQNTVEFIAIMMGVVTLYIFGVSNTGTLG